MLPRPSFLLLSFHSQHSHTVINLSCFYCHPFLRLVSLFSFQWSSIYPSIHTVSRRIPSTCMKFISICPSFLVWVQPILDHIIAQQYNSYIDVSNNPLQCGAHGWLMENSFYLSYIILSDPLCKWLTWNTVLHERPVCTIKLHALLDSVSYLFQ